MRYFSIKFHVLLPVMLFMVLFGVGCNTPPIENENSNINNESLSNISDQKQSNANSNLNTNLNPVNDQEDVSLYKNFNSKKDVGIKNEFSFFYPNNLIHFESIDGGFGSTIPFFDKTEYIQLCGSLETPSSRCSSKPILEVTILTPNGFFTEAHYDKEVIEKVNVSGFSGIIQTGTINSQSDDTTHLGEDGKREKRLILDIFNNAQFGIFMLIESEHDEQVFKNIVQTLNIVPPQ